MDDFGLVANPRKSSTAIIPVSFGKEIEERKSREVKTRRGRPPFSSHMLVCKKCGKRPSSVAHYFAETAYGAEKAPPLTPEQRKASPFPVYDCGDGYLHGYAECHGMKAEFIATFDQVWAAIDTGAKIYIFDLIEDFLEDKGRTVEDKMGSPELTGEPEMKRLKVKNT